MDDEGVTAGDWLESREAGVDDAVPSLESLFFFEDLLSLPRESWRPEHQRHAHRSRRPGR